MLPDRVSNPGPLTYESGALPIALRGPASHLFVLFQIVRFIKGQIICRLTNNLSFCQFPIHVVSIESISERF